MPAQAAEARPACCRFGGRAAPVVMRSIVVVVPIPERTGAGVPTFPGLRDHELGKLSAPGLGAEVVLNQVGVVICICLS